jgi:hypothetical protein
MRKLMIAINRRRCCQPGHDRCRGGVRLSLVRSGQGHRHSRRLFRSHRCAVHGERIRALCCKVNPRVAFARARHGRNPYPEY